MFEFQGLRFERVSPVSIRVAGSSTIQTATGPSGLVLEVPEGVEARKVPADRGVGWVVTIDGVPVYVAGATGNRAEMFDVRCRVAILPVSPEEGMDPQEAAEAAGRIRPELVIPVYRSREDAEEFALLARCRVELL